MRRLLALLLVPLALAGCGDDGASPAARPDSADPRVTTVARGLDTPWEIAFLPDRRALITERPGRVRLLERGGRLAPEPVAQVDVAETGEGGLLGLAVDPLFERNRYLYLYRTTASSNEVARYRFSGDRLVEEAVIVRGIQPAPIHDGGRLRFGPDGRLYISTGDAAQSALSQDRSSLNGKVLRLSPDAYRGAGGRPEVFTLGHRNVQGFDWQPGSRRMVATEHGDVGNDELNVLRRGANYGWPEIEGDAERDGMLAPVNLYEDGIAPSGATFVRRRGSAWTGDYLIACLVGERIQRVRFAGGRVVRDRALFQGRFGRLRTVVEGPDGAVYALTNNRDGRGTSRQGDDRVLRIVPPG
jgi:glucose/arabinose dehydrogenase